MSEIMPIVKILSQPMMCGDDLSHYLTDETVNRIILEIKDAGLLVLAAEREKWAREEAEWLAAERLAAERDTWWGASDSEAHLLAASVLFYQRLGEYIASLREKAGNMQKMHNAPEVKVTWPNEHYHLDGEGCKEK
jgi:hypothetical protein